MKILVIHAWMRGNLGDIMQTYILLKFLRSQGPDVLDMTGYPANPPSRCNILIELLDRYIPEPFSWYLKYVPSALRNVPNNFFLRGPRRSLFRKYDVILSAPGPFLAEYDARLNSALFDMRTASALEIPFILSSHSIGPLPAYAFEYLRRVTDCIAREKRTYEYLGKNGVPCHESADFAFLYPFPEKMKEYSFSISSAKPYKALFARSNNLDLKKIALAEGKLLYKGGILSELGKNALVLATSDIKRDREPLEMLSRRLNLPCVFCGSVEELTALIRNSTGVISDRYHPIVCATALGRKAEFIPYMEDHKMSGLRRSIEENNLEGLKKLSRSGLERIKSALKNIDSSP